MENPELFKEWANKVQNLLRRINEKTNLTKQQVNHLDGRIEKIENTILRHDQRMDRLQNEMTRMAANESSAKALEKQLQYFKLKALLIQKTPGGAWVWIVIDAIPAIILSVVVVEFIHLYGYHSFAKRLLDFIFFR